jgi:hypothetical protein
MIWRKITVGESLWTDAKKNGIIDGIDYSSKTVFVNHYDNGRAEYDFDDLLGNFDERLNQWVISPL